MKFTLPEQSQQEDPFEDEELSRNYRETFRAFISELPVLSPPAIADELERLGYKGQDEQRRALALMAYRHVRRLKRMHVDGEHRNELPPKQNILMLGPTGCGKTFLVELLFQNILKLPTVIVDITSFTESGYIGDDVRTILTRLIINSGGNPFMASCGVVCLDEFDKIASSGTNARFAGQGTTKDVSGYGVQRELLAMLQGTDVVVPMDYGFSQYGYRIELSTQDIPFIACGAFSGLDDLLQAGKASIGFRNANGNESSELSIEEVGSFQKYGFLPELVGRFARIISFPALPAETLRRILIDNVLPQFQNEFRGEGLKLNVTDAALGYIVTRSQKRGTGARGLQTEITAAVERAAFETFMRATNAEVLIDLRGGRLESEVRGL
ncbi:MAG TPA: AAA family ATPase [Blastocatellia bacterium]|jgi:ATP-dependent Clp protease ATP-binding subunit ClpX|nr:AAA family ATPase [Blastocatellia bacterium]